MWLASVAVVVAGCGRGAESRAAERAQDACLEALEPVSRGEPPSPEALRAALGAAEAAATGDRRWAVLPGRVRDVRAALAGPAGHGDGGGAAMAALVEECERVNAIVKRERQDRR